METIQAELRKSMHYLGMAKRNQAADKIDALLAQVEALTAQLDSYAMALNKTKAERDSYKKDAERYQWLRNRMPGQAYRVAGIIYGEISEVDKQIDAAIAKGTA